MSNIIEDNYLFTSILAAVILVIVVWLGGKFLKLVISRIQRFAPDLENGLKFLTHIFQIYIITIGLFTILGASQEFLLGLSALLVTVIGFASTSVASNIFGGLYLILTKPFKVGDLIKTQGAMGIVEEIGLNYTRIVKLDRNIVTIPNNNLINASLLNYNIRKEKDQRFIDISNSLADDSPDGPYVKLRSSIQLQLNVVDPPITVSTVIERLDHVCEEFAPIFGFKPFYFFGKYEFRLTVDLLIIARNGYTIFNSWPYLLESIIKNVFIELQEEEELKE